MTNTAWEGSARSYQIHIPPNYDPAKPTPLVLALHGASMNAPTMERFTGLSAKADQAGFIVVYPNGTGPGQILLTRHAYDEARRFVRSHPALEGQSERPELVWRIHGAYPFKGFAERCEVCEIGAEGDAPLEPPSLPTAAGATDKALKITVEGLRLTRSRK